MGFSGLGVFSTSLATRPGLGDTISLPHAQEDMPRRSWLEVQAPVLTCTNCLESAWIVGINLNSTNTARAADNSKGTGEAGFPSCASSPAPARPLPSVLLQSGQPWKRLHAPVLTGSPGTVRSVRSSIDTPASN